MGLFDKIKKAAPTAGATAASIAAGQATAKGLHKDHPKSVSENLDSNSNHSDTFSSNVQAETVAVQHYPNGNVLVEHADGSRIFYDAATKMKTEYDAHTGSTNTNPSTDQEMNHLLHAHAQASTEAMAGANTNYSPLESASGGLFSNIRYTANGHGVGDAQSTGLHVQTVNEVHTHHEGSFKDGHLNAGFETKHGIQFDHHAHGSSHDELVSGATLDTQADFQTHHFAGATSQGNVNAQWNARQAELHAHGKVFVGAESSTDAQVKETLGVEGIDEKLDGTLHGHATGAAGAGAEGQGDASFSRHSANVAARGEAFAGAKASAEGSGALGIDGHDFARGQGGVDARAGIGAGGRLHAGYEHSRIHYEVGGSAALGVGAGFHYGGSVDAPGIVTHPDAVLATYVPSDINHLIQNPTDHITQQLINHVVPTDMNHLAQNPTEHITEQVINHVEQPIQNIEHDVQNLGHHLDPTSW